MGARLAGRFAFVSIVIGCLGLNIVAPANAAREVASLATPGAAKGTTVNLAMTGLPTGVRAKVTFSGPVTISATVTSGSSIILRKPGKYSWTVTPVQYSDVTYSPRPASGSLNAVSGRVARIRIAFTAAKPTPPGPPQSVTLNPGDQKITVNWLSPSSNGGATITGYEATASPGDFKCSTQGSLTCEIAGLVNGTAYNVQVVAINSAGMSAVAAANDAATPRTVPSAPGAVTAVPSEGQAVVSWTAPQSDGGSSITGYTAVSAPGGRSCTTTGALSCTVTGLTNGIAYTFTVSASNTAGASPSSLPSPAATPDYTYSPIGVAVQDGSGMAVTMKSITVTPKSGSTQITISYSLTNITTDKKLDEGTCALYFSDGTREGQYGFFGSLFPGDSKSRSYTWEYLSGQTPQFVQYDPDSWTPVPGATKLRWRIP